MRVVAVVVVAVVVAASCTNEFSLTVAPATAGEADEVVLTAEAGPTSTSSPASTSTTTLPPSTTVPPRPIRLGFVGDVQMIGSMAADLPLAGVADLLSAPDLTFANLETVVGEAGEVGTPPIDKEFIFRSPPETLDQLVAAGVDVVALANNHTWDFGPTGATVTRARVDASPLIGVGAGPDAATAYAPAFVEIAEQTIGIVSLSRVPCDWSRDPGAERPEIAYGCDRFALPAAGAISAATEGADHTVVMLHAGTEITDCPDEELRSVIDVWIKLGADVISISHPHVLQGVEIVDGAAVLWSTGNFAFRNGGGRTGRSAVFEVTLSSDGTGIRVHPTLLPGGVAEPAGPETAAAIRGAISERSVGGWIDDSGYLVPDAEPSICG